MSAKVGPLNILCGPSWAKILATPLDRLLLIGLLPLNFFYLQIIFLKGLCVLVRVEIIHKSKFLPGTVEKTSTRSQALPP